MVEDFDLAEVLVVLLLAFRHDRRTQRDGIALYGEAELVAVQVVALGDLEADLDGLPVQRAGGRPEGDRRVEELLGMGERKQQR